MPSAGEFFAALFRADVIPIESAAGFAAFVPPATHLLVASSVTKELPLFLAEFAASRDRLNDARFLRGERVEKL